MSSRKVLLVQRNIASGDGVVAVDEEVNKSAVLCGGRSQMAAVHENNSTWGLRHDGNSWVWAGWDSDLDDNDIKRRVRKTPGVATGIRAGALAGWREVRAYQKVFPRCFFDLTQSRAGTFDK